MSPKEQATAVELLLRWRVAWNDFRTTKDIDAEQRAIAALDKLGIESSSFIVLSVDRLPGVG